VGGLRFALRPSALQADETSDAARSRRRHLVILFAVSDKTEADICRRAVTRVAAHSRITVVEDGVALRDILCDREKASQYQVVLMEIRLARISGLDVLEAVKGSAWLWRLPIIVLVGSDDTQQLERAYELGARGALYLPVDFDEVNEAIEVAVRYWAGMNLVPSDVSI
jgi:two-component system, response regulator